ncbi:hypothetical protein GOP47_0020117 [Adiantum capillus-veneris]|uniref:Myb/SANT-like DNA-binding domain-containing protein n=1 Tax=Adiantum capillus-veneris TaxID=13818 RepID=A0A9D4Z989_ADICA|nr:hypothetical protein GOP47_0020117 [Adiantum capillus-veneris]
MENFTPDLNTEWCEDDETVPCSQYSPTWGVQSLSFLEPTDKNGQPYFSQGDLEQFPKTPCSQLQHCFSQVDLMQSPKTPYTLNKAATTTRTPLTNIANVTPPQMAQVKGKLKARRGKRAMETTSQPAPPIVKNSPNIPELNYQPMPTNIPKEVIGEAQCNGGKPIQRNMFYASGNWTIKETATLLDARTKLFEDMRDGNLNVIFKTGDERWDFISKYCVQRGVLRSADQCLFHWDSISALFKKVHDYERHIPSGCDSYWKLSANQQEEMKLPRTFLEELYTTMLDRVGKERQLNHDDIVYDTMKDNLGVDFLVATIAYCSLCFIVVMHVVSLYVGDSFESPNKAFGLNKKEDKAFMEEESLSGKKRKRGDKMTVLKKELESTTKRLISFIDNVDARRSKHDDEVIELTKAEFEEAVTLNRKRLALEEESNEALKQIADAFKCFAVHASKHSF